MENRPRGVCGASPITGPDPVRLENRPRVAPGGEGLVLLVLPLASGCRPPVVRVAPGGEGPVLLLVLGCCPPVVWDAVRRWCVWPRVGRGLFRYSFWDAASTSAI